VVAHRRLEHVLWAVAALLLGWRGGKCGTEPAPPPVFPHAKTIGWLRDAARADRVPAGNWHRVGWSPCHTVPPEDDALVHIWCSGSLWRP
jgi:hypothetical protein